MNVLPASVQKLIDLREEALITWIRKNKTKLHSENMQLIFNIGPNEIAPEVKSRTPKIKIGELSRK